jgi:hypothetical protein
VSLNVLISNYALGEHTGAELYTRDLARELQRLGHTPAVYAKVTGPLADELRRLDIPVATKLRHLDFQPDIVQGHERIATLECAHHFPGVPVVFVCHNHSHWSTAAPKHPGIQRYFGMSQLCVQRMIREGVPGVPVELLLNWVDMRRFLPRGELPPRPRRALVFSNYAAAHAHLPAVVEACRRAGLTLDVVGRESGTAVSAPENCLGEYDIVFAKAKAALEAMATGCAVVLCDFGGVGPMVTFANFQRLQPMNFGFEALTQPLRAEDLCREIACYDAEEARKVRDLVRTTASMEDRVQEMLGHYRTVIERAHPADARPTGRAHLTTLRVIDVLWRIWLRVPSAWRETLKRRRCFSTLVRLARGAGQR